MTILCIFIIIVGQSLRSKRSPTLGDVKTKVDDVVNFSWATWIENAVHNAETIDYAKNQVYHHLK